MAMNLANCSDQNFYLGTSAEFSDWKDTFNTSSLKEEDIVLYLELDTKVINYNVSVEGERDWKVYGVEDEGE